MKIRLVIEVPQPVPPGERREDFYPNIASDTHDVEKKLPAEAVVVSSEYVAEVEDTKAIFKKFLRFKLEGAPPRGFKSGEGYEKGDEDAPFFSESYLYNLVGKDDARTILGYLHHLMKCCCLDPFTVQREVCAEIAAEEEVERRRVERIAKRRDFIDSFAAGKGWKRDDKTAIGYTEAQNAEIKAAMKEAGL